LGGFGIESLVKLPGPRTDEEIVTTDTLDNICQRHGIESIHFLKVDVQGAEAKINGASRLLERSLDCILMTVLGFRERLAGESKLDEMVIWEYGLLLADKTIGRLVPVRFVSFAIAGGLGVLVHMAIVTMEFKGFEIAFSTAQSVSTVITMIFNFALNNLLTYRNQRLNGWAWVKGLIIFMIACSIGGIANVGIATYLFENRTQWILSALAGVLVGAVWNYAVTQLYVMGRRQTALTAL
jgi:putative flippase GtrA